MKPALTVGTILVMVATAVASVSARPTDDRAVDKSDNVKLVTNIPYSGGSDIAFQGKYVYFGQLGDQGGIRVLDKSGKVPKEVAFIACPGSQNDVAIVKPGLLALGYHSGQCGGVPGAGVRLIDVRNPRKPRFLSSVDFQAATTRLRSTRVPITSMPRRADWRMEVRPSRSSMPPIRRNLRSPRRSNPTRPVVTTSRSRALPTETRCSDSAPEVARSRSGT